MKNYPRCRCCGTEVSSADHHNKAFDKIMSIAISGADEFELAELAKLVADRINTSVKSYYGDDRKPRLAYPDAEKINSSWLLDIAMRLDQKLDGKK